MSINNARVGVLGIQGSVEEHVAMLRKLRVTPVLVKTKKDLARISGLIIPGGESTTIGKLMKMYGLDKEIIRRASAYPLLTLWGTCAGAILLAKKVSGGAPDALGLLDIEIERNAYGRQIDSFETEISVDGFEVNDGKRGKNGAKKPAKRVKAIFIRAPQVKKVSKKVTILAEHEGKPVMVRQENILATMFHPELTDDTRIHSYFLSLVEKYAN